MTQLPFERLSVEELADRYRLRGSLDIESDTCGFFLCEQGNARLLVNDRIHQLSAGDVYLHAPSNFIHLIEHSDDVQGIVVKSSLSTILPFINKINAKNLMTLTEEPCFRLTPPQCDGIEQFANLIAHKREQYLQCANTIVAGVRYQQLIALAEAFSYELFSYYIENRAGQQPSSPSRRGQVFQEFMLSLSQYFKLQRSVHFYANLQHLSPRYFNTLIRKESGRGASEWIAEYVVTYSRQLLTYSDKSVKQIAQEFHFPDQSFFGKYFKQHTGLSPKEFRKMHGR